MQYLIIGGMICLGHREGVNIFSHLNAKAFA